MIIKTLKSLNFSPKLHIIRIFLINFNSHHLSRKQTLLTLAPPHLMDPLFINFLIVIMIQNYICKSHVL